MPAQKCSAVSFFRILVSLSSSWSRGYYTGLSCSSLSFREVAPNWIDFALLSQRQRQPRRGEGFPFHYLELGSGMGVGLCLLAAAYPEGRFVGIDFHPDHIAYSTWLASELQLTNICFHEADFLHLAGNPQQLPFAAELRFEYVVAHGIISWVAEPVRQAVLSLAESLLRPGGVFYCSYNTYPGWFERSAFKALADLERQRLPGANPLLAMQRANHTLARLLGAGTSQSPLARAFPQLPAQLNAIATQGNAAYLCAEFANDHWQPFYVGEMHRLAAGHKLSFLASATGPENYPALLPPALAAVILEEADPLMQQAVLDLAINQSFRRDLFVKGVLPLRRTAQQQALAAQGLRLIVPALGTSAAPNTPTTIETSLGLMVDGSGRCQQLEGLLAQQPASLGTLHQTLDIPPEEVLTLTSLLLHSGRVGLDRGAAGEAATPPCSAVNQRLMDLMQTGNNLSFLAAPAIGHGAEPFSILDAFVLAGIEQRLEGEVLTSCVWMGMDAAAVEMRDADGEVLTDPQQRLQQISQHIDTFRTNTLPRLVRLGITDQPG